MPSHADLNKQSTPLYSLSRIPTSSSPSLSRVSVTSPQSSSSSPFLINQYMSLSFLSTFRSLWCSALRWSHGINWRSPASTLRAQIKAATPVLGRFEQKIETMEKRTSSIKMIFLCMGSSSDD